MIRKRFFWTTSTGQIMRITDMTNKHLLNTIKFLHKRAHVVRKKLIEDAQEVREMVRGVKSERVQLLEAASDHEILMEANEHYPSLIREAVSRGLI